MCFDLFSERWQSSLFFEKSFPQFSVQASDGRGNTARAFVVITILRQVADQPPQFIGSLPYNIPITIYQSSPAIIGSVACTDPDLNSQSEVGVFVDMYSAVSVSLPVGNHQRRVTTASRHPIKHKTLSSCQTCCKWLPHSLRVQSEKCSVLEFFPNDSICITHLLHCVGVCLLIWLGGE